MILKVETEKYINTDHIVAITVAGKVGTYLHLSSGGKVYLATKPDDTAVWLASNGVVVKSYAGRSTE